MNTTCCPPVIALHRPWWSRLAEDWFGAPAAPPPAVDYASLADLSERTLRDIGAPDWVHARDRGAQLWTLERARW